MLITGFLSGLALVSWALTLFAAYAFVDAAFRRDAAYRAADKKTKTFWLIVLAVSGAVVFFLPIMSFLPLIALVAVIVYMVDVRPAVREISGLGGPRRGLGFRRGGPNGPGGGSSSDGPYGPYNGRR
ncbi:DUF2516 family protein [Streptomyces sp. NBC_01190]|uniref:DUF2516 family protein n=1 Tax=Streptomyces sp. NBC_01190 TaxID=2903767 RepID=UPI003864F34E|nr:DUF2516 family protein [Streptomyces sp. NBC_01190]